MQWTLDQLAFVARWTIWPLLHPFEQRLEDLRRIVTQRPVVQNVYVTQAPQAAWRQECNVSTLEGAADSLLGSADVPASLEDAHLLYRATGGEKLIHFVLSSVGAGGDDYEMSVEIQRTDSTRTAASSFPVPIVLTVSKGADPVEIALDQSLDPGDFLVAVALDDWTGKRVDVTVIVSKS